MLKNLKQLARFAIIGIVAMVIEVFGLVGGSLLVAGSTEKCQNGFQTDTCRWFSIQPPSETMMDALGPMGKAMSIFLFSYAILATVPSVRSQLKDPSQMPKVLSTSFGFCALLNIGIMSIGYFAFGGNAPDNQNDGLSLHYPSIAMVVAVAIIVNLLLSTPLYSYCLISVFEATGHDALRTPLTPPNMVFRACLILALATTNHFLPYAMEVIGLVSSVFACANNILFPVLFFYLARRLVNEEQTTQQDDVEKKLEPQTTEKDMHRNFLPILFHGVVLVVGCCVLVFGFQGSLNTLLDKIAQNSVVKMGPVSTVGMIRNALKVGMVM
jgi:amino acid permease